MNTELVWSMMQCTQMFETTITLSLPSDDATQIGSPTTTEGSSNTNADDCCRAGVTNSDQTLLMACTEKIDK